MRRRHRVCGVVFTFIASVRIPVSLLLKFPPRASTVSCFAIMASNGLNGTNGTNGLLVNGGLHNDLEYADKLNADPERIKFAYWVPNVSGGLVISKIPQRTNWDLESNVNYARTAEKVGTLPFGHKIEKSKIPWSLGLLLTDATPCRIRVRSKSN
jgi:hypothetical protein